MRSFLLLLFVFSLLPIILVRPHIGLLAWSWLGYMNPHRLTWGLAYSFPFVQVVAITTLIAMLFSGEPKRMLWTPLTVVWLSFVTWMCLSTLFAVYPEAAWENWWLVMKIQLMILATLLLMQSKERLHTLIWVIVLSIGYFGIKGGVFTVLTGGKYTVWGPAQSFIAGNNEMALALLITLPLMRYLQLHTANKWIRRGLGVGMVLVGLSIAGSYSRGAFVGSAAMLIMLWLKTRRKLLIGIPLVAIALVTFSFMPQQWHDRMATIQNYEQDRSAMGRLNTWQFAYHLALDRPLTGAGFQAFSAELFARYAPDPDDVHDAHSIYFEVLAEQGFVGLALFLMMGFLTFRTGSKVLRLCKHDPNLRWASDLAAMLQVSIIGYAAGGAFLGLAYFDLPYHFMALMVLTRHLAHQAQAILPVEQPARVGARQGQGKSAKPAVQPS